MLAALDDLSLRLRSVGFLTFYETPIAFDTRETTLQGGSNDLRSIFAIQIGSGTDRRVLDYVEPKEYLNKYDNPETSAGLPTLYTVLATADGFPTVAFDCPLAQDETAKIYYYCDIVPENVAMSKSIAAVSTGTLAYFFGLPTDKGKGCYAIFEHLSRLSREADDYTAQISRGIPLNKEDHYIRGVISAISSRRT